MKLFEVEKKGDITEKWYADETGTVVIQRQQDVNPILDLNKQLANGPDELHSSKDMKLAADIPIEVWNMWNKKYGGKMTSAELRKELNDPDNRMFRVWGGRM